MKGFPCTDNNPGRVGSAREQLARTHGPSSVLGLRIGEVREGRQSNSPNAVCDHVRRGRFAMLFATSTSSEAEEGVT